MLLSRGLTCSPLSCTRTTHPTPQVGLRQPTVSLHARRRCITQAAPTDEKPKTDAEVDETTKKYGLEAGLFKVFSKDDNKVSKTDQAKQLLAQYGSAYLITSISFAIVSFGTCYALVNAGIDIADLLAKIGLQVNQTSEQVGTFAIAYAAHKALSPVRFPPTVALTPVVAKLIGKEKKEGEQQQGEQQK